MQRKRTQFWFAVTACLALGSVATRLGRAQGSEIVPPPATLTEKLQSMAARAAVIFAGQVTAIERTGDVVEITFRVDQAVLGAPGAIYTLREWAGLWPPGMARYTVGQRALLFANPGTVHGLNSPVDGADGVVPVLVAGANSPALMDVRRLEASLLRSPDAPLSTEASGAIELGEAIALIRPKLTGVAHAPARLPLPGSTALLPRIIVPTRPLPPAAPDPASADPISPEPVAADPMGVAHTTRVAEPVALPPAASGHAIVTPARLGSRSPREVAPSMAEGEASLDQL